ncbi:precorrin-2 dehydrogenase/sirohydrochlorin ferrochelatase family protein [Euzebya rosea]|uniref:precorrin-2 dehydrogenase/sirohydrochlorin ferrochelatase family protein n=1 Tax=Euzebya rosea TaxID=2052804 RepID=UPI00130045F0|nr:bifunctional precorrin-2 dehydrogenase/sirohydrochlorin ferrochelatase [Euzebya rosea]
MAGRTPLLLDLAGRRVTCVGGGPVAAAKVVPLAAAGAEVHVISPTCHPDLAAVATHHAREWQPGDLHTTPPTWLVVAATGVREVDDAVHAEAEHAGTWCLRIDGRGPVAVPSVIRDEDLVVAVSTGAPALTKRLRQHLEATLGGRWADAARTLAALRRDPEVRAALAEVSPAERRDRWRRAVDAALATTPEPPFPHTPSSDTPSPADVLRGS